MMQEELNVEVINADFQGNKAVDRPRRTGSV